MQGSRLETHETDESTASRREYVTGTPEAADLEAQHARDSSVDADIDSLIQTLRVENRKKPLRFGVAVATLVVVTVALQATLNALLHVNVQVFNNMWMVWVGVAAAVAPTRLQKATARQLAQFDDIRAVGPLAEALDRQDGATQGAASAAIARLLPRMKASDAGLLDDRQRDYLLSGLNKGTRDLKLAILKALSQIGDKRFLKAVTSLSEGRGSAKRDLGLRSAAKDCIEPLQRLVEAERVRVTLLRPAESTPSMAEDLLRPASCAGGAGEDGSLLVRPSSSPSPAAD